MFSANEEGAVITDDYESKASNMAGMRDIPTIKGHASIYGNFLP